MFKKYFSRFLNYAVMIVLFCAALMSMFNVVYYIKLSSDVILCLLIAALYIFGIVIYKKYGSKVTALLNYDNFKIIIFIVLAALILRILWVVFVPTQPTSDFNLMYKYAGEVAKGQYYGFKGNAYFSRFAHDTVTVLYFSLFYHITNYPLTLIKALNILYETSSVYLIYLIVKEAIGKKSALISAALLAVFPAYIMYTSETMSENIALPFYLLGVYLFLKSMKSHKKNTCLILCGLSLSIANMFRMVGSVFIVAFIVYLLIYKGFKELAKSAPLILISYGLLLFLVSQCLISAGVTERQLWNSKEPGITSVLKGTNMQYEGRWNEDDAKLPSSLNYDGDKIKQAAEKIIIQRLTETPPYKVVFHYLLKLSSQWGSGDFGSYGWSVTDASDTPIANFMKSSSPEINLLITLIYLTLLIRIFRAMINKDYEDYEEMNFFYILFGGFVLLYLITELQERYAFIVAWLIVIFAVRTKKNYSVTVNKNSTSSFLE